MRLRQEVQEVLLVTDVDLISLSMAATVRARTFMRESGNTHESVNDRGHDIAIDLLLEKGEDTRLYKIKTVWTGGGRVTRDMPMPNVRVTRKDVVTVLGETA
jgi:predicted mannosyl-3-phosphoglycerate phosphatase (HAD superfamily)